MSYTQISKLLLISLILTLFVTAPGHADDQDKDEVPTTTLKLSYPADPKAEIEKKPDEKKLFKLIRGTVTWSTNNHVDSGFIGLLSTPDFITYVAYDHAKSELLEPEERAAYYKKQLKAIYGGDGLHVFQEHIIFVGKIRLSTKVYEIDAMNADWHFYLYAEGGKRYKASSVILGDIDHEENTDGEHPYLPQSWVRTFYVTFENKDPKTEKPILTPDSKEITFAVAGTPGQGKLRYEFIKPEPEKK